MLAPIPAGRARDHFTRTNMSLNYSAIGLRDRGWQISRYRRKHCRESILSNEPRLNDLRHLLIVGFSSSIKSRA